MTLVIPDGEAIQEVDFDAARAFTSYRNYLNALSSFISASYKAPGDHLQRLAEVQNSLNGFKGIRKQPPPIGNVRELLFNAWHTELALALPEQFMDEGLLRFTNQWAPVQAYYAVYSLCRAWFRVQGHSVATHMQVLRSISSDIRQRALFPPPWNYACAGGYLLNDVEHIGFLSRQVSDVNPLSTPGSLSASDDWVSKALRTTRRFFLQQNEDSWKSQHRTNRGQPYRRIPPEERRRIRRQLHPTTLFDFLYRLRIRSNYRDVDDFVSGQLQDADALMYFQSLLGFTQSTMLLLESIIRAMLPAGHFDAHAQKFLNSARGSKYSALSDRLRALRATDSN